MLKKIKHIHFTGVGGIGMSGIAEVLANLGYFVSGSDIKKSEITEKLKKAGVRVYIGHRRTNIRKTDVVVYSSAISRDNPELKEARKKKITIIPRAEMLAELMRLKYGVAVAGTHGKTTTASMAAYVLTEADFKPTSIIGGKVSILKGNAKLGKGDYLVAEADESDGSFLHLSPTIAIVTNIDNDHLDHYGSMKNLTKAFISFVNSVPFYGCSIICADDKNAKSLVKHMEKKYLTYGIRSKAHYRAKKIRMDENGSEFYVYARGRKLGKLRLGVAGMHNVLNSLSIVALSEEFRIKFNEVKKALLNFKGVARRMEKIVTTGGIMVMDDYAHHPTEIKATLKAVRNFGKRVIAVFQPHRYSRTKLLQKEYGNAFDSSDKLIITDIYPAGEKPIKNVSSGLIVDSVKKYGNVEVEYVPRKENLISYLDKELKSGDLAIFLGAGDINKIAKVLGLYLKNR